MPEGTRVRNLSAIVRNIATRLLESYPERQVEFMIEPVLVAQGDAALLEITLTNLMDNAFKFTGARPRTRIEFGQIILENKPTYNVRDNGVGFDMDYADRLFGTFQRLHSGAEFPGIGIGLATVQRIM